MEPAFGVCGWKLNTPTRRATRLSAASLVDRFFKRTTAWVRSSLEDRNHIQTSLFFWPSLSEKGEKGKREKREREKKSRPLVLWGLVRLPILSVRGYRVRVGDMVEMRTHGGVLRIPTSETKLIYSLPFMSLLLKKKKKFSSPPCVCVFCVFFFFVRVLRFCLSRVRRFASQVTTSSKSGRSRSPCSLEGEHVPAAPPPP